ncbi:MAG: acyltransferase family protein [Janthinobacterium lividum]
MLRAFAVLLVMVSHLLMYTGHSLYSGWMGLTGVCLFFVHTCLVLMWSLERDPHSGRFYIRRAFRLFPLWLVVLFGVLITHLPISPPAAPAFLFHRPSLGELLANITLTFNLKYGARIVGASWSLPIEAQMYLLLPLLYFFVKNTRALWVLLVIDALAIVSVWVVTKPDADASLAICIPYFLPGVMAFALSKKVAPRLPAWSFPVFLLLLAAVHRRYGTLFVSSLFCLVIGLALPFFQQLTWKPLVRTAHEISRYPLGSIFAISRPSVWGSTTCAAIASGCDFWPCSPRSPCFPSRSITW